MFAWEGRNLLMDRLYVKLWGISYRPYKKSFPRFMADTAGTLIEIQDPSPVGLKETGCCGPVSGLCSSEGMSYRQCRSVSAAINQREQFIDGRQPPVRETFRPALLPLQDCIKGLLPGDRASGQVTMPCPGKPGQSVEDTVNLFCKTRLRPHTTHLQGAILPCPRASNYMAMYIKTLLLTRCGQH